MKVIELGDADPNHNDPSPEQSAEVVAIYRAISEIAGQASSLRVATVSLLMVVEEVLKRFGIPEPRIARAIDGFAGIAETDRKAAS